MSCQQPITDDRRCAHDPSNQGTHKKRLIVCCDGTWNNSNTTGNPTNVSRLSTTLAQKCCTGMPQIVYYHRGVGTDETCLARLLGGFAGTGVLSDIKDCYRFICENYSPGDEIVLVGFSRGAFTARSVAGIVCSIGLLNSFGLANFGAIFDDYQAFSDWREGWIFDKNKHLKAFSMPNNLQRETELKKEKEGKDLLERCGYLGGASLEEAQQMSDMLNSQRFYILSNIETLLKCGMELAEDDLQKLHDEVDRFLERKFAQAASQVQVQSTTETLSVEQKVAAMAKIYRKLLNHVKMIRCVRKADGSGWEPESIRVKAVGVWDTVGSLGYPKMPGKLDLFRPGRNPQELRFANRNVHENVEFAIQALALDEWRTMFEPTLWGKSDENKITHLRQVWFPGSHSDVGGGSEDQRLALVSFAWMSDQLSSVGVEFVPQEMERLFRSVDFKTQTRNWGMGKITRPGILTSLPDIIWDSFCAPVKAFRGQSTLGGSREPGLSETKDNDALGQTHELIHPSVRVRYLYGGMDMEDKCVWKCAALTSLQNGYRLYRKEPIGPELEEIRWMARPNLTYGFTYTTLAGEITSVHGGVPLSESRPIPKQLPFDEQLYLPKASHNWIWQTLSKPEERGEEWVWGEVPPGRVTRNGENWVWNREECEKLPHGERWAWVSEKNDKILYEEEIGMWERLFIRTNEDDIRWEDRRKGMVDAGNSERRKEEGNYLVAVVMFPFIAVASAARTVKTFVGNMLSTAVAPKDFDKMLKKLGQTEPGYYDFVLWQHGDLRRRLPAIHEESPAFSRAPVYQDGQATDWAGQSHR